MISSRTTVSAKVSTEGRRFSFWRWFDIARPGQGVYLRRLYLISTPWFGVYLHNIRTPDPDLDRHDHPWSFVSWVLRGGYLEEWSPLGTEVARQRDCPRWSWHRMRAEDAHRIVEVRPDTWTLVFVGPRRRVWGFYVRDTYWVEWTTYLRELGMLL